MVEGAVTLLAALAGDVIEAQATARGVGVEWRNPVRKVHRLGC